MAQLIVEPTPAAQWLTLVTEAEKACALTLGEELQSYLVFLLMRNVAKADIGSTVLALDYLNGNQQTGRTRENKLQAVGDNCLLFAGLFPKQAEKRLVRISYFVHLGQSAYASLASVQEMAWGKLFAELSQQFVELMDVLQTMRAFAGDQLSLLEAEALWRDTGSKQALQCLQQSSQALWVAGLDTRH
jgi:hypothetical protein